MRIFLTLVVLFGCGSYLFAQNKAAEGTYQITVPNIKVSQGLVLSDQTLEEIENYRQQSEDRKVLLTKGMMVLVISRQSVDEGRRVFKWKIDQE